MRYVINAFLLLAICSVFLSSCLAHSQSSNVDMQQQINKLKSDVFYLEQRITALEGGTPQKASLISTPVNTTQTAPVRTTTSNSTTSSQCGGMTKKGVRCSRMVKGGGNCYQH